MVKREEVVGDGGEVTETRSEWTDGGEGRVK